MTVGMTTDIEVFRNQILHGDCLAVLRTLPDHSVDSVVTDPPYGLGTREPTSEDIIRYINGSSLDTGGDFMSNDWEIPPVEVWKECRRVLKPGGYVLAFAGTRTWDIMSLGLRAAGFDNRDTVASQFGPSVLSWVQSQGFPKSMNISKAIAKLPIPNAAEIAARWVGYGTALKPAWEPVLCFRSPSVEDTIAEQFVETGTGGINIDATRVKHANAKDLANHQAMVDALKAKGGSLGNSWKNSSNLSGANDVKEGGRWPGNVVLTHAVGCKLTGTRKVYAPVINRFDDGMKPFGNGAGHAYTSTPTGDVDGKEDVAVYECAPGCPVGSMNEQLEGGSRFFAQFQPDAPFFYAAKASRAERNAGLLKKRKRSKDGVKVVVYAIKEDVEVDIYLEMTDIIRETLEHPADDFDLEKLGLDKMERDLLNFVFPKDDPDKAKYLDHWEVVEPVGNDHPCVKPVSLMKYLVRLVTPKGGIVLDPYCGSGTTCQAAVEENDSFIGIEKDEHFFDLAHRRVVFHHDKQTAEEDRLRAARLALSPDD